MLLEFGKAESSKLRGSTYKHAKADAAAALLRITRNEKHIDAVVAAGAIEPLMSLLRGSTDEDAKALADAAEALNRITKHINAVVEAARVRHL